MSDKLTIRSEMAALDGKDREFYDSLTDEEKKKFSVFLMIRYGATVTGIPDLQAYYLQATNQRLNKNFFEIGKQHEKLNWLAATTVSPGMGNQNHQWIPNKKKDASASNKTVKFLQKIYPHAKASDIELLAAINDVKTLKAYAKDMGMTPEQIKKELG